MPRHELGERVSNGNDRFLEIRIGHPSGTPQSACASHVATASRGAGTVNGHDKLLKQILSKRAF